MVNVKMVSIKRPFLRKVLRKESKMGRGCGSSIYCVRVNNPWRAS